MGPEMNHAHGREIQIFYSNSITEHDLSCNFYFLQQGRGAIEMYIFRASMKLKDGTVIYARDYGKKAFKIWIDGKPRRKN